MSSSATTSGVTRYRPAILVATGLAAAYATYLVYCGLAYTPETSTKRSSNRLHRSNAVHRPSRHRRISIVTFISHDHQDEFPDCICAVDDRQYQFSLLRGGPSRTDVMSALRLSPPETDTVIHEMQLPALDQIFHVIVNAPLDSEIAQSMPDIRDALDARNSTNLLAQQDFFTNGRWTFDLNAYHSAVAAWCMQTTAESPGVMRSSMVTRTTIEDDAETVADESGDDEPRDPGQGLKGLLYHIAEGEAKRSAYVHRGTRCDSCNQLPITGIRWHCLNCPDFDLCSTCEAVGLHPRNHVFAKVQVPIPPRAQPRDMCPLWYPGQDYLPHQLQPSRRKHLSDQTGYDEPRIDALFDQFLSLSTAIDTGGKEVFTDIPQGIDRLTFHKIFAGDTVRQPMAPNYLNDRLFDFYDQDKDGQITFPEFVLGQAYLTTQSKRRSLDKVFQGYDANGDGYISRADMVRMLRSKYIIHKDMVKDIVTTEDVQPMTFSRSLSAEMRSNRTISSMFSDAEIPRGESRRPYNKPPDAHGEPQVLPDPMFSQSILPNGQTDIDLSFFKAVFNKHGRPDRLSDLHPQFNDRLDARIQVRDRYTGSESFEIDGTDRAGDRYLLVPSDSRDRRPITTTGQSLAEVWKQDIADVNEKLHNGHTGRNGTKRSSDGVFQSDRTVVVSPEERDVGDEVLYQVIEDAMNEILDPLFAEKEQIAHRVQLTKRRRERFRKEIDEFVKSRDNYSIEELAHDERMQEKTSNVGADEHDQDGEAEEEQDDLFAVQDEYLNSTTLEEEQDRSVRSASPSPEQDSQPVAASPQVPQPSLSLDTPDPPPEHTPERPQLSQADLIDQIRAVAVPTDESSLRTMEQNIRDDSLAALLASAGYSVADDNAEVPPTANDNDADEGEADRDRDAEHANLNEDSNVPDLGDERENVNVSLAAFRGVNRPSAFSDGPSAAAATRAPESTITFVAPGTSLPESRSSSDDLQGREDLLRELPWSPASVRAVSHDLAEGEVTDLEVSAKQATRACPEVSEADFDGAATAHSVVSDDEATPTAAQLEEYAMLDKAEEQANKRGGPARIDLHEFEQIVWKDEEREDWHPSLKGVVEGWLEWAYF